MSNFEIFRKTYISLLTEAVNKDPDGYMFDASEAPAVADKMLVAIQKGSASNSNTLKRVAKKLGIEPTMAAMRVYLKAGEPKPDDKPDDNSNEAVSNVMTLVLPAVLQAAGSRTGVYKLTKPVSPNEQKHVAVLVKMLARKWPAFYIRFSNDGSSVEVPRIIGMNAASIKAWLKRAATGNMTPDDVKPKPAKSVRVPDTAAKAKAETKEPGYAVNKARYAKGMMTVRCETAGGWKTRAMRLAEYFSRNRYSHREHAYIMSPAAASKFEKAFKDGYDASYMSRELIPPAVD